ncbi:MAG: hypothetical protein KAT54_02965, partial [Candidatus Marinimicrobia bacterium]|nr:hypothetical protein [Candidatus Neomarinimicrobiota bacterium]
QGDISTPVVVDEKIISNFKTYLDEDGFFYYKKNEKKLRDLEKELLKEEHFKSVRNPFASFYAVYDSMKVSDFDSNPSYIKRGLTSEISTLAGGLTERIKNDLDSDPVIKKAMNVILDEIEYQTTLGYAY